MSKLIPGVGSRVFWLPDPGIRDIVTPMSSGGVISLKLALIAGSLLFCGAFLIAQVPVEVVGLRFPDGEKDRLVWDTAQGADEYVLYQGDAGSLAGLASGLPEAVRVMTAALPDSGPALTAIPPPGGWHWFLVTARNESGTGSIGAGRTADPWQGSGPHLAFAERFPGTDDDPWPPRWENIGSVDDARMGGGWARWRPVPSGYSLARIYAHGDERDVEVTFTFQFEDHVTQGIGFYVRSNGLYLDTPPAPVSMGYAVFIEDFRCQPTGNDCDRIGVWKEEDGQEIPLSPFFQDASLDFQNFVPYRVRFRCEQVDPGTTRLRARIWIDGEAEPDSWHVDLTDTTPQEQGIRGGFAVDSWSSYTSANAPPELAYIGIRDIRIRRLFNPVDGAGAATLETDGYLFPEGPVWVSGQILFSDIDDDRIYAYPPGGPPASFRAPSGNANGLARARDGDLLAAEHGGRRISRIDNSGGDETLAGDYNGNRFNSPNDVLERGDGTVYFTDPRYGLESLGNTTETGVSALYRVSPDGIVTQEWSGDLQTTAPNGLALSPDHRILYVNDTDAGTVRTWDVAYDGTLSNEQTLLTGLNIPDGMCVDMAGNLYIAQWNGTIEVFDPSGERYGTFPLPNTSVTNCAFGEDARRGLYVTSGSGLYRIETIQPGRP